MRICRSNEPGYFKPASWGAMIQRNGYLTLARPNEKRQYFLSGKGAGIHPLVIELQGNLAREASQYDTDTGGCEIVFDFDNDDFRTLYMWLTPSESAKSSYSGLFPAEDAIHALTDKVAGIGLAGLGEGLGGENPAWDAAHMVTWLRERRHGDRIPTLINAKDAVWVFLHYMASREAHEPVRVPVSSIGADHARRRITFGSLRRQLLQLVGRSTTELPSWEDWKKMSAEHVYSIRKKSAIANVDAAFLRYLALANTKHRSRELQVLKMTVELYIRYKRQKNDGGNRLRASEKLAQLIASEETRLKYC